MNPAARSRVAAAALALAGYAACGDTAPQPYNQAADTEKLDYARPRSIERPEDYDVRIRLVARASRSRVLRSQPTQPQKQGNGGDLPPARIVECESGGSYTAENPSSSASGRYQITDGSWNGFGGYRHAADAPPQVQDERARQMWANGAGWRHWKACA